MNTNEMSENNIVSNDDLFNNFEDKIIDAFDDVLNINDKNNNKIIDKNITIKEDLKIDVDKELFLLNDIKERLDNNNNEETLTEDILHINNNINNKKDEKILNKFYLDIVKENKTNKKPDVRLKDKKTIGYFIILDTELPYFKNIFIEGRFVIGDIKEFLGNRYPILFNLEEAIEKGKILVDNVVKNGGMDNKSYPYLGFILLKIEFIKPTIKKGVEFNKELKDYNILDVYNDADIILYSVNKNLRGLLKINEDNKDIIRSIECKLYKTLNLDKHILFILINNNIRFETNDRDIYKKLYDSDNFIEMYRKK